MNPLILYHANCADGFGAAYAAWKHFKDNAEYVPVKYDEAPPVVTDRDVYILDFSFPKPVMLDIIAKANFTTWLDHHKTAFENWVPDLKFGPDAFYQQQADNYCIVLDNKQSGAMLSWCHFQGNNHYPQLITHIDDYDRWVFKYADTKPFNKALWSCAPWSFEQWDVLANMDKKAFVNFVTVGRALLRDHQSRVIKHVEKSRKATIDGRSGLTINAPGYVSSDAGHELAVQSGTFGMTYTIDEELKARCSLRSNGEYDVTCLARVYGGGGHKNAAGFTCTVEQLMQILCE